MKKFLSLLLMLLCLCMAVQPALALNDQEPAETTEPTTASTEAATVPSRVPGQCGENAWWSLSGGTLTISGSGAMDDCSGGAPWADSRDAITTVVIGTGITYIGAKAFENYDKLTAVDFGGSLYEIGTGAFKSCDGLTEITLPSTFRVFGEESFYSCAMLQKIHFDGSMPKFKLNCLWDTYADLIFPAKNPWPLEHIKQLEEAFQGRIEFLASDGTDPYTPEDEAEETTKATTAPTEETIAPTTAPATVPTTAPTEAAKPTTEQTEPTETAAETTTAPTEEAPERSSGGGLGFAIIMAVLSLLALVILVFGRNRRGGKYSR